MDAHKAAEIEEQLKLQIAWEELEVDMELAQMKDEAYVPQPLGSHALIPRHASKAKERRQSKHVIWHRKEFVKDVRAATMKRVQTMRAQQSEAIRNQRATMLSVGMRLVMESRLRECHSESSKLHTMVQLLEAEDSKSLSMADVSSRSLKLIDFNADIQTTHTEMAAQAAAAKAKAKERKERARMEALITALEAERDTYVRASQHVITPELLLSPMSEQSEAFSGASSAAVHSAAYDDDLWASAPSVMEPERGLPSLLLLSRALSADLNDMDSPSEAMTAAGGALPSLNLDAGDDNRV